jgi:RNA polymerase-associated protein
VNDALGASRSKVPEWVRNGNPLFLIFRSLCHDGAVFRNNLPLFPPLPFVLFEKGMDFEIRDVDLYNKPEDISVMNPYGQVPILVERDLILYESNIINEYIDERFPHPQLMPGDPVDRARVRLFLAEFRERVVCSRQLHWKHAMSKGNEKALEKARAHIRDRLTQLAPVFLKNKYMLGDNFSMLDVAIAPLLWRLDFYGIDLSKNAAPLLKYAERIFSRPAYIEA